MSIEKPKKIEEYIINELKNGPLIILDLVELIRGKRSMVTKQAVYSAIRILKNNEQIVVYKGVASLNMVWINSMLSYFSIVKHNYVKSSSTDNNFIDLDDKDKIKYYFQNPLKADIFWTHALYLLLENNKDNSPIFLYNPHEWFLLARYDNEVEIFNTMARKEHKLFLTVSADNFLDRYVAKYFDNTLRQYNILNKPLFKDNNYYLNIIGDFIIEVWFEKSFSNKLDKFYKKTLKWDDAARDELNKIVSKDSRLRIVISRNKKKAEKIKKSLNKYFFV